MNVAGMVQALTQSARDVIPLVSAAACVGVVIGVVTLTGVGTRLPGLILPLAQGNLFLALLLIMLSSIILGLGLPSVVCYLLMATWSDPCLARWAWCRSPPTSSSSTSACCPWSLHPLPLPLTRPASIAQAPVLAVSLAAFRFALVGFTLPYMFVYRPELLLLGEHATAPSVAAAVLAATAGILAFAAAIAGHLATATTLLERVALFAAALLLLAPAGIFEAGGVRVAASDLAGGALLLAVALANARRRPRALRPS
jgi:TRAP-type uncharacterized transport system fused permease subunit